MEIKLAKDDIGYIVTALLDYGRSNKSEERSKNIGVQFAEIYKYFEERNLDQAVLRTSD